MNPTYKYPPGSRHVSAIYSTGIGAYENNPLIAALQQNWDDDQIAGAMSWWPHHDVSSHTDEPSVRADMAMQLKDGFETMPWHISIVSGILSLLRRGYLGREGFVHGHTAQLLARAAAPELNRRYGVRIASTGNSLLIYGLPGTGKTAFVLHLSALLPQIIDHTEFQGKDWPCRQVTYLRVTIQQNWTDKALAQAILLEFDRVAGTDYTERVKLKANPSAFDYLMKFTFAANNHGLGMLILDEVQLLKSNTTLLNFALNFSSDNRILLVMVGTPASVDIMGEDPRFMRRAEAPFDPEFKRYEFPSTEPAQYNERLKAGVVDDDLWTWFLQSFWHIQYTARPAPLTHELSSCLHNLSVGITHYAVNLFIAAQLLRIGTDHDILDRDALLQAYATCSKPSMEYLHDLRTNNVLNLKKYTDFAAANLGAIAAAAKVKADLKKKEAGERLERLKKIAEKEKKAKAPKPKGEPKPKPDPVDPDDLPRADLRDFLEP